MIAGPAESLRTMKVLTLSTQLPQPWNRKQRNVLILLLLAVVWKTVSETYGMEPHLTRRDCAQSAQEKTTPDFQALVPCPALSSVCFGRHSG